MPVYKFYYFDLKAMGEVTRLVLAASGQKFEDIRYGYYNQDEWLKHKHEMPFEQMPMLEVTESDGTQLKIAQSGAICRFLANRYNMAGSNETERVLCDMIGEQMRDMHQIVYKIYSKPSGPEKEAELAEAMGVHIPHTLKLVQNILDANKSKSGFLVGNSLTYADLYVIYFHEWLHTWKDEVLTKLPSLKAHDVKIRNCPGVKEHLQWNVDNNVRTSASFG